MSRIYTHRDPELANVGIPQLDLLTLLFGEFGPVPSPPSSLAGAVY